jgi:hypothetical protein
MLAISVNSYATGPSVVGIYSSVSGQNDDMACVRQKGPWSREKLKVFALKV